MPGLTFMLEVFGLDRFPHSLTYGCATHAESYKDLTPQQIYRQHENEKKSTYTSRVMEVEQATSTPLVFTTTVAMAPESQVYKRLAELLSAKKGD